MSVIMYRVFLFLIFFVFVTLKACADYIPSYVNPNIYYGNGIISIKGDIKVYELDDEKARVSAIISENNIKQRGVENVQIEDVFLAHSKENNISLLSVEIDSDDWYYVCYNQKKKLFGWVKKNDNIDYMSWEDFFNVYGRKRGILLFRNLKDEYKKMYSAPSLDSTIVDDFHFAKHIALWLVKGDWMLVKITTYDGLTKTGWIRWKLKDGSLTAFPDFKN